MFYLFLSISVSSVLLLLVSLFSVCLWGASLISFCTKRCGKRGSLTITLFWILKSFGSVYMNPTYFFPLCSPLLKTPKHKSILYQYFVLILGRGSWGIGTQHQPFLWFIQWPQFGWIPNRNTKMPFPTWTCGIRGRQCALKRYRRSIESIGQEDMEIMWTWYRQLC